MSNFIRHWPPARYLDALAVVDDPAPAHRALERLVQPVRDPHGRSSRAFNPATVPDLGLLSLPGGAELRLETGQQVASVDTPKRCSHPHVGVEIGLPVVDRRPPGSLAGADTSLES